MRPLYIVFVYLDLGDLAHLLEAFQSLLIEYNQPWGRTPQGNTFTTIVSEAGGGYAPLAQLPR